MRSAVGDRRRARNAGSENIAQNVPALPTQCTSMRRAPAAASASVTHGDHDLAGEDQDPEPPRDPVVDQEREHADEQQDPVGGRIEDLAELARPGRSGGRSSRRPSRSRRARRAGSPPPTGRRRRRAARGTSGRDRRGGPARSGSGPSTHGSNTSAQSCVRAAVDEDRRPGDEAGGIGAEERGDCGRSPRAARSRRWARWPRRPTGRRRGAARSRSVSWKPGWKRVHGDAVGGDLHRERLQEPGERRHARWSRGSGRATPGAPRST